MHITRNGQEILLTQIEMEQAYIEQNHKYLLEDAEAMFYSYINIDPYHNSDKNTLNIQQFADKYGFDFEEAVDSNSEHYLLEKFVDEFEGSYDGEYSENYAWEAVIEVVLSQI